MSLHFFFFSFDTLLITEILTWLNAFLYSSSYVCALEISSSWLWVRSLTLRPGRSSCIQSLFARGHLSARSFTLCCWVALCSDAQWWLGFLCHVDEEKKKSVAKTNSEANSKHCVSLTPTFSWLPINTETIACWGQRASFPRWSDCDDQGFLVFFFCHLS